MTTIFNFLDVLAWGGLAISTGIAFLRVVVLIFESRLVELARSFGESPYFESIKMPCLVALVCVAWLIAPYV